jgi:hypothetical protein
MAMSVVVIAGALWIVLALAFAVVLGRTVRLAHRREARGPPTNELVEENAPSDSQ